MDCGMVRPKSLEATRSAAESDVFGYSTGRSTGLAPLRIRSAKWAARRRFTTFGPSSIRPAAEREQRALGVTHRDPC
jgi:hypothetical protein